MPILGSPSFELVALTNVPAVFKVQEVSVFTGTDIALLHSSFAGASGATHTQILNVVGSGVVLP